jgi:hypothetical protein
LEGGGEISGYRLLTDFRTWCLWKTSIVFYFSGGRLIVAWPVFFCVSPFPEWNVQVEGAQPKRMELDFSAMDAQAKDTVRPIFTNSHCIS